MAIPLPLPHFPPPQPSPPKIRKNNLCGGPSLDNEDVNENNNVNRNTIKTNSKSDSKCPCFTHKKNKIQSINIK